MLHAARPPRQRDKYESGTDEDDFVDDDQSGEDWRSALKQVTGYDPSRCVQTPSLSTAECAIRELRDSHVRA